MNTHLVDSSGNIRIAEQKYISRKNKYFDSVIDMFSEKTGIAKEDLYILKGYGYEHSKIVWITGNKAKDKNIPDDKLYTCGSFIKYELQVNTIDFEFNLVDGLPIAINFNVMDYKDFEAYVGRNVEAPQSPVYGKFVCDKTLDRNRDIQTGIKYDRDIYSFCSQDVEKCRNFVMAFDEMFSIVDDKKDWSNNANNFFATFDGTKPTVNVYDCFTELKDFVPNITKYEVTRIRYTGSCITLNIKENDKDEPSRTVNIYLRNYEDQYHNKKIYYLVDATLQIYTSIKELKKDMLSYDFYLGGASDRTFVSQEELETIRKAIDEPVPLNIPKPEPKPQPTKFGTTPKLPKFIKQTER